jgi:serine/threonine-protein kinase
MPEIPTVIGRYLIARELAHGGMGSLYLARDPAIDRLVAIKLLREGFEDESVRERFAREVRATGRLHHPNIVTIFDTGEHGNRPFIAMEYIAGETLASVIHRRAPVSIVEKLTILEEVCDALGCAHEAGIIHRDIKPANVMIEDATGTVKILDFGIAHAGETGLTNAGEMVGTLNYMAPEQISGPMVDQRTDIYAVGVLAYELLSYQRAFAGSMQEGILIRLLHGAPPALESVVQDIDPELSEIVKRAMAKQPADRYADMEQLRRELGAVRARLADSGADVVEPLGVAVDADAETVAGQEVPPASRARTRRSTGTGRRPASGIGSRASTPLDSARGGPGAAGTHIPVRHRRVVAASVGAVGVLLAAISVLYWQQTRSTVSIEPPRPEVEAGSPAPQPEPSQAGSAPKPPAPSGVEGPAPSGVEGPAPSGVEGGRANEQQLVPLRATARRQLKAGRPQEALDTISAGLVLNASDPELRELVDDLARAARQSVTASRAATAKVGVTEASSADVREARGREREAEALERSGNHVAAIRALWTAAALYDRSAKAASTRSLPAAPAAAAPQPGVTGPPQPSRVQSPAVVPLPPGMLPPATDLPLPAPPPPTAKPAAPAVDPRAADLAAIRELLRHYVEAYAARDVNAVAKVMPFLTQQDLRQLERDFSNYRSYRVEIADERIAVDGATATVRCRVARSFVSRTGTERGHTVQSLFHLRKAGGAWVITSLQ